jgi:hemerythrin-like domain-containing protein
MTTATAHPLANFEEPLRVLRGTHMRIELRLALLAELCHHVHEHGIDESACTTASVVLRYFDDAESKHQDDEERDLFPALAAATDPSARESVSRLLERLAAQHDEIERSYQALRPHLARLADGEAAELPPGLCARLHDVYMQHIEIEEAELLPLAERSLTQEALRHLGSAMAARRNVDMACA